MRLSIPRPVRRWRWEWLAVLLSTILFYGSCGITFTAARVSCLAPSCWTIRVSIGLPCPI